MKPMEPSLDEPFLDVLPIGKLESLGTWMKTLLVMVEYDGEETLLVVFIKPLDKTS